MTDMETTIHLGSYDIMIGSIRNSVSEFLNNKTYSRVAILVDEHTQHFCLPVITRNLPEYDIIQIQSGEAHKSLKTCSDIWSRMADLRMDRHSLLINLGGGVIGDMGGFAASCYMRGIHFIQIPTTLLSQVDASVGGKLAVDFKGYKNFIGLFQDPKAVLIDPHFLVTLPQRELRSGFAEMIKHALIGDQDIWNRLIGKGKDWKDLNWNEEIVASVLIKKNVVHEDPTEKGLRKILNFGHTIGHAIESLSLETETPLLHGEAIALGMIAESVLSVSHSSLKSESLQAIATYICSVYDDINYSYLRESTRLLKLMQTDKKNKAGAILFSLLGAVGKCNFNIEVTEDNITAALQETERILADT